VLAGFLVEFLPFEEEARDLITSVELVLQENLVSAGTKHKLWEKARVKNAYYVGFLRSTPDDLPGEYPPHPGWQDVREQLAVHCETGNPYAGLLCRLLSGAGQGFLGTTSIVLSKPLNQDVVVALLNAISGYFSSVRPEQVSCEYMDEIEKTVDAQLSAADAGDPQLAGVLEAVPAYRDQIRAMLVMSRIGESVVNPIFSRTDAIGTLMRRKLQPVSERIQQQIDRLTR
jgi:hypothetical protein